MLKFVRRDMMLWASGLSPILAGVAIRFVIPLIEKALVNYTGLPYVITPYYSLLDILYSALTPAIFCFVVAMVMLEERDDHIDRYLFVTGLGRQGYYISRLVIPAGLSFVITMILLPIFRLTNLSLPEIILLALVGTLQGIIITLLVFKLSSNKLEGMAITKLSSLLIMGCLAPYFVPTPLRYIFVSLPSYWTGAALTNSNALLMLPGAVIAGFWILILYKVKE